jgi:Mn2+/Fe2+ NRAMP family transporter
LRPLAGGFACVLFAACILGVGLIGVPVLGGPVIQYSPMSPMKALCWSAVISGVVAVPLIVVIIRLAGKASVMGAYTAGRIQCAFAWAAALLMGCVAA